jgi:exosome complex component RRP42
MEGQYALELIMKGKRMDERKFEDFREIKIEKNVVNKAEGSARVKIGETEVMVGVKLNTGKPFPDTPEEGILIVNAEFTPLASPDFESGPPGENAVELARVVDRGIRESKCIEVGKLCIVPEENVWMIFVDIHIINDQGNLLDAAALAAITALSNAKIPKIKDEEIVRGDYEKDLPVVFKPINITVGKVGNNFLVDPNFDEEKIMDAKLSVSVRDDEKICALQKQGTGELSFEDLEKMVDIAMKKSEEIRKLV